MGSPSRNVQYHPPRLSEDRLNLPQPHSPSLPTHCSGKSGMPPAVRGKRSAEHPSGNTPWHRGAERGRSGAGRTCGGSSAGYMGASVDDVAVSALRPDGRPRTPRRRPLRRLRDEDPRTAGRCRTTPARPTSGSSRCVSCCNRRRLRLAMPARRMLSRKPSTRREVISGTLRHEGARRSRVLRAVPPDVEGAPPVVESRRRRCTHIIPLSPSQQGRHPRRRGVPSASRDAGSRSPAGSSSPSRRTSWPPTAPPSLPFRQRLTRRVC